MARKKRAAEGGGVDQRWMLTFSDMMTLLLTFFVLLFSMSSTDSEKLHQAMKALKDEFAALNLGTLGIGGGSAGAPENPGLVIRPDEIRAAVDEIKRFISAEDLDDDAQVTRAGRRIKVSLAADVLFDTASVAVKPAARPLLHKIAGIATRLAKTVRVEGNTDSTAVVGQRFNSNLDLSAYRATSVLKTILEEKTFTPRGACVGAFGEYNPVRPKERNDRDRRANRRVDIFVVDPPDAESFWYALMESYLSNAGDRD
ncbi:MAG TPA: flagellar motor protein MotB [bacterium]|nr:flagellar motor protein MotB [bacterium]